LSQDYDYFDVVIAENSSPEREAIRAVASDYVRDHPGRLSYYENTENLGYDGNLRRLFELARGEYVLFMGNDDLMCPGALEKVAAAIERHPDIGVLLRSYAAFDVTPDNIVQTFRYFDREIFFPAGAESIATIYRRSVVIPGMVIHREAALRCANNHFDGTLLYQLYIVAEIVAEKNAIYLPEVTVLYRNGGTPDFGHSAAEKGNFEPNSQTPASSLHFIKGMLAIARHVGESRGLPIYNPILRDLANYSYPLLAIQAGQPLPVFLMYGLGLVRMGLWISPLFWAYWISILIFGVKRMDGLIGLIKGRLGRTPRIGKIYEGVKK
jgi:glycosyltransferase involved in cell wall biosynthesis